MARLPSLRADVAALGVLSSTTMDPAWTTLRAAGVLGVPGATTPDTPTALCGVLVGGGTYDPSLAASRSSMGSELIWRSGRILARTSGLSITNHWS